MTRIFLTGASGYIAGDLLHLLAKSHPEYHIRALVRDSTKGEAIKRSFNEVQIVNGSLDDINVVAREALDADVVVHLAASGHLKSVQAIHQALFSKATEEQPRYWIQISGGSVLGAPELANKSRVSGSGSDTIYNDLTGVESIRSLIRQHPTRAVDNYMLSATPRTPYVKTAVVVPPIIYGQGRGPVNQRSIQIPELAKATLQRQKGVQVGLGLSRWGNVHIWDLSRLILALVEKATKGVDDGNTWGRNGLYFAGNGELSFGEISRRITAAAYDLELIPSKEVEQVTGEDADKFLPHGSVLYGTNARAPAHRAEIILGWKALHESLEDEIPRVVAEEARALNLLGN
ncbi:hypothetical protein ACHAPT_006446 [Fusarium lateritium]